MIGVGSNYYTRDYFLRIQAKNTFALKNGRYSQSKYCFIIQFAPSLLSFFISSLLYAQYFHPYWKYHSNASMVRTLRNVYAKICWLPIGCGIFISLAMLSLKIEAGEPQLPKQIDKWGSMFELYHRMCFLWVYWFQEISNRHNADPTLNYYCSRGENIMSRILQKRCC